MIITYEGKQGTGMSIIASDLAMWEALRTGKAVVFDVGLKVSYTGFDLERFLEELECL